MGHYYYSNIIGHLLMLLAYFRATYARV
jgi:hypothetical protein